jgi:hypothetical protein
MWTLLTIVSLYALYISAYGGILLKDVQVQTFTKGGFTVAGRSPSTPQLVCVGGSASKEHSKVESIQCKNVGFDGQDYNWKCESVLPKNIRLGRTEVVCEGFSNPVDPYILKGSCGLEYTLEYVTLPTTSTGGTKPLGKEQQPQQQPTRTTVWKSSELVSFAAIALFIFVALVYIFSPRSVSIRPTHGNFYDELSGAFTSRSASSQPSHGTSYYSSYDSSPPPRIPTTTINQTIITPPIYTQPTYATYASDVSNDVRNNFKERAAKDVTKDEPIVQDVSTSYAITKRKSDPVVEESYVSTSYATTKKKPELVVSTRSSSSGTSSTPSTTPSKGGDTHKSESHATTRRK